MTDKITLNDLATFDNSIINAVNANNDLIEAAMDNTLSRDGTTPNQMGANLDMNGFTILNLSVLNLNGIGTSDPHVAGQLWSNAGVLTVSGG